MPCHVALCITSLLFMSTHCCESMTTRELYPPPLPPSPCRAGYPGRARYSLARLLPTLVALVKFALVVLELADVLHGTRVEGAVRMTVGRRRQPAKVYVIDAGSQLVCVYTYNIYTHYTIVRTTIHRVINASSLHYMTLHAPLNEWVAL